MLKNFADLEEPRAPAAGELPELARRLHQLKGSAGTLGVGELERVAAETESACQAASLSGVTQGLLLLAKQLHALRRVTADFLEPPPDPPPSINTAELALDKAAVTSLHALLGSSDLAALQTVDQLAPMLRQHLGADSFKRLRSHIDDLAFQAAAELLAPLLETQQ